MDNITEYEFSPVNSNNFFDIGFVMIPGNPLGVYVPRLMSEISMSNRPKTWPSSTNSSIIKNANFPVNCSNILTECNYFMINNPTGSFNKGDRVLILYLEQCIENALCFPFSI